ncbi:MAG: hypothetical protein QNL04_03685 [SAR324 cluster bacterium]|nr:hypothetical protein [SAR324 cluster bacterium]
MSWETNQFYPIPKAGEKAKKLSEALIKSYSLTRIAYEVLGDDLLKNLEFSFVGANEDIIVQGERGLDLFLICVSPVHVVVGDKVVVTMDAPVLLGDKALIWPDSKRAATIRVPEDSEALVLKIPMGLFLREFTYAEINDASFSREKDIYSGLFQEIQKRLFSYIPLQKTQFEAINTSIININTKLISSHLDQEDDQEWPPEIWESTSSFVSSKFGFKGSGTLTAKTFKTSLHKHFEEKYPRSAYDCPDHEYPTKKQILWERWLNQTAHQIVKHLPPESLSFTIKKLQLFNPENYREKIENLIKVLGEHFINKTKTGKIKPSFFFTAGEHSNDFELQKFIKIFGKNYFLKYPERVLAKMAQTSAKIAAECENEFNAALAKMKDFKENTESLQVQETETKSGLSPKAITSNITQITRGFNNFNKNIAGGAGKTIPGEAHYISNVCPTLADLIKYASTKSIKDGIENSFFELADEFGMLQEPLTKDLLSSSLRIVNVLPGYKIPSDQLEMHYWFPISPRITFKRKDVYIEELQAGAILGGEGWNAGEEGDDDYGELHLALPEREKEGLVDQSHLLFVFPHRDLSKLDQEEESFTQNSYPWLVWIIQRHLLEIKNIGQKRSGLLDKCMYLEETMRLEEIAYDFEDGKVKLDAGKLLKISEFLKSLIQWTLPPSISNSGELAKAVNKYILEKYHNENPDASEAETKNDCYTQFRFLLSEMVRMVDTAEVEAEEEFAPMLPLVQHELLTVFKKEDFEEPEKLITFDGEAIKLKVDELFALKTKVDEKIGLFRTIMDILEPRLLQTRRERRRLEERYTIAASGQSGEEAEATQKKFIQDQIKKLEAILKEGKA